MKLDLLAGYGAPLTTHTPSWEALVATKALLQRHETLLEHARWDELRGLGTELAGHAAVLLEAVRANALAVRAHVELLSQAAEAWRAALHSLAKADSDQARAMRAALTVAAVEAAGTPEAAERRIEALLHGEQPIARVHELVGRASEQAQEVFADVYVAATSLRARLGMLAAFHAARTEERDDEDDEDDAIDEVGVGITSALADSVEAFAARGLAELHAAVQRASSARDLRAGARAALEGGLHRALLAGDLLGRIARLDVPEVLRGELGPAVARLAEGSAQLGLLTAYAAHVRVRSHTLGAAEWLEREREAAALPHPSQVPTGRAVALHEVAELHEGTLVRVQGTVEEVWIEDDPAPPRFSSILVLRAFEGTAILRVRAHMRSLRVSGLAPGSCCTVRGFVRRGEPWLEREAAGLDIDRVSLTRLRTRSWVDDVTYRMRPFFMLFPGELNLYDTPGAVL